MRKIIIMPIVILATLFLTACGGDTLEGNFVSKTMANNPFAGLMQVKLSFSEDGKVRMTTAGNNKTIFKYEKDGDEITLSMGNGMMQILTVEENGNLIGMGQEFVKLDE